MAAKYVVILGDGEYSRHAKKSAALRSGDRAASAHPGHRVELYSAADADALFENAIGGRFPRRSRLKPLVKWED